MVKKILAKSYLYLLLAILYAPIILIIVFSFFNTSTFSFNDGFSFEAYKSIFTSKKTPDLLAALKNTLLIAAVSSVCATIIGAFSSIGIFSLSKRTRRVVENVNQLPIINSEIVMAVSLMVFFVAFKFPAGYFRLIIGHISFCTPYVILSIMPKLQSIDSNIYEAALDLGATPFKAMRKVMLPMITPGIISGFVMAFTLSMDDFIITQINKGAATGINTLSTYIYADARVQGLSPFWFAIFSIIFVVVLTTILVFNIHKNSKAKAAKEVK
ncbi:MAG: ABC transporter permease [Clostridia bacterium]